MRIGERSGWLEGVSHVPSPNFDARPAGAQIELLVIHAISLPPGLYGGGHVHGLFTNCLQPALHPYFVEIGNLRVSAHVLIDRQGEITQYVSFLDRAWHAGRSEFAGRSCCNDYSIGIELEGCDEDSFEEVQYQVLVKITKLLIQHWPSIDIERIVGHCHIASGRKTDPGPHFDWKLYFHLLAEHSIHES